MQTFNPRSSPDRLAAAGGSGSPDLLGEGSQLLQRQAVELNNAAEQFMAQLDQSDKKRFREREQELSAMAGERQGTMASALSKNFFGDTETRMSNLNERNGRISSIPDAESGMAVVRGESMQRKSQSSHDTSKFRDAEAPAHASDGDGLGSPGPYVGVDMMSEAKNEEATISRYLVGQGHDSVSRGGNSLQRTVGRGIDANGNRASLELRHSLNRRSDGKQFASKYLRQSQENQLNYGGSMDRVAYQGSVPRGQLGHQSSQGDLIAPQQLFNTDAVENSAKINGNTQRDTEHHGGPRLSKPPSDHKFKTVQQEQDSLRGIHAGGPEAHGNLNHLSKMAYMNSNSVIPTIQSREYLKIHSDHGTDKPIPRRDQDLQSPPDLAKQRLAQSTLSPQESAGARPPEAVRVETFNGQASLSSSMALNQRIWKLREELDGGNNPLISSDVQNSNLKASQFAYNYVTQPQKSPKGAEESLDSRMKKAQMQTDQLLDKARSRSPISGSHVSQRSAIYVETKRSQSKSISKVLSNATDVELPLGKACEDSQVLSKLTDETKNRYVITDSNNTQELKANAYSLEVTSNNLEMMGQDGNNAISQFNRGSSDIPQKYAITTQENSLDRGATNDNSMVAYQAGSIVKQKSASLRSRNLSFTNLNTTNSGTHDNQKIGLPNQKRKNAFGGKATQSNKIRSKSVKFQRSASQKRARAHIDGIIDAPPLTAQDSLNLDKFYKELILRERQEFERILKSKVMVVRHDTQDKLKKQIHAAEQKAQKVADLERQLAFAQRNCEKLRTDWSSMKQQLGSCKLQLQHSQNENKVLRAKLDDLWEKHEEEKDLVMLVTKSEVEKAKSEEISRLQEKIDSLESDKGYVIEQLSKTNTLEQENSTKEAENSGLKAGMQMLTSKCERLELENKRLKQELEISQTAQMEELRYKYDSMKQKYQEMAKSGSGILKDFQSQRKKHDVHANKANVTFAQSQPQLASDQKMALDGANGRRPQRSEMQLQDDDDPPSDRYHDQNTSNMANGQDSSHHDHNLIYIQAQGSSQFNQTNDNSNDTFKGKNPARGQTPKIDRTSSAKEQVELWQLRCKLLAEKYFNIIKDLKKSLKKLKASNRMEIEKMRKEMSDQVLDQLRGYISRLEQRRTQSSQKGSALGAARQSVKSAGRARSGSQRGQAQKNSSETIRTQHNRLSSTYGKINSDIDHLNQASNYYSIETLQNLASPQTDSIRNLPSTSKKVILTRPASKQAAAQIPEARDCVTPGFQAQSSDLINIRNQKQDLQRMIEEQQRQIDIQQDELDRLKSKMKSKEAQLQNDASQRKQTESEPKLLSGQFQLENADRQVTVGEANESEAARLAQQFRASGTTHESGLAAHASKLSSDPHGGSLQGFNSSRLHAASSQYISNQHNLIAPSGDRKAFYDTRTQVNNTRNPLLVNKSQSRSQSTENSQYKSKFAQNYSRVATVPAGVSSMQLSQDQRSHLEKIRSQNSSHSNSRHRSVHQTALVNGQQYHMASLRTPIHHYFPSQAGPAISPPQDILMNNQQDLVTPPSVQTHATQSVAVGQPVASNQGMDPASHVSSKSYSAMANSYNLPKDDRSPSRYQPAWQQPIPQILQGSPNSAFYEHLRQNRTNTGNRDGTDRSDLERPKSLGHRQAGEAVVATAYAGRPLTNPSSVATIQQIRADSQSDLGRIDARLQQIHHLNQISNALSPTQENAPPGSMAQQVGGYPMQFQPPQYYNIQEEKPSNVEPGVHEGDGEVSFQQRSPPDNTLSLAKYAAKDGTLSLDKFAQNMIGHVPSEGVGQKREQRNGTKESSRQPSSERGRKAKSNKSVKSRSSPRSNQPNQFKRKSAQNMKGKSSSVRQIDKNNQKRERSESKLRKNSQQSLRAAERKARASSTKANRKQKHSRKGSNGHLSNKSKSANRSSNSRTPQIQKEHRSGKSRGSTKSIKSKQSSVKSQKRIINLQHHKGHTIGTRDTNEEAKGMLELPNGGLMQDHHLSNTWQQPIATNVQLDGKISVLTPWPDETINNSLPSLLIPGGSQMQPAKEGKGRSEPGAIATKDNSVFNSQLVKNSGQAHSAAEPPSDLDAGVNMSTFEKLNEEIQKSINSLKEMSQQKAFNVALVQGTQVQRGDAVDTPQPAEQPGAGGIPANLHGERASTGHRLSNGAGTLKQTSSDLPYGSISSKTQPSQDSKSGQAPSKKGHTLSHKIKKSQKAAQASKKDK